MRLVPRLAISRFGVARCLLPSALGTSVRKAPIIGAVLVAIADDRRISAKPPLPRLIKLKRDPFVPRRLQAPLGPLKFVDQITIDEQLPATPQFDDIFNC